MCEGYGVYPSRAVLTIGENLSNIPQIKRGIFSHVTRLDQLRASEDI